METQLMIVDDSEEELDLLRDVFEAVAPELVVSTANGGREALERVKASDAPKVILLDLRMHDMGGLEVLKQLKADSRLKHVIVCAFSNGDLQADVCECYSLGASFYFRKPTGLSEVRNFAQCLVALCFRYALHCHA